MSNKEVHDALDQWCEAKIAAALKVDVAWFTDEYDDRIVGGFQDGVCVATVPLDEPWNFEVSDEFAERALFS